MIDILYKRENMFLKNRKGIIIIIAGGIIYIALALGSITGFGLFCAYSIPDQDQELSTEIEK